MTFEYSDRLCVDGTMYRIDARPLAEAFKLYDLPAFAPIWPVSSRGYFGYWAVFDNHLVLEHIWPAEACKPAELFPHITGPVVAHWFSGLVRGRGGERRYTGASAREFFNDEVFLEVTDGVVARRWSLDLRSVPDQTDAEFKRLCPEFLWPERLR